MRVQIVSDIHLEFRGKCLDMSEVLKPVAPVLIAAGDIGRPFQTVSGATSPYANFIKYCSENWRHVILVAGNHEYHSRTRGETIGHVRSITIQYSNVSFLENETCFVPGGDDDEKGTHIAGCTFWTPVSQPDLEKMNDKSIQVRSRRVYATDIQEWHQTSVDFITQLPVLEDGQQWVIVTHHIPRWDLRPPNKAHPLDGAYYNSLDSTILNDKKIKCWVYGHNHQSSTIVIDGIKYITNAMGYPREVTGYNRSLITEL